ncbi:unnamed protein product [Boreogadus saida]
MLLNGDNGLLSNPLFPQIRNMFFHINLKCRFDHDMGENGIVAFCGLPELLQRGGAGGPAGLLQKMRMVLQVPNMTLHGALMSPAEMGLEKSCQQA